MKHKNGLKEATAKLKAQGFKAGGEVKAEMTKKEKSAIKEARREAMRRMKDDTGEFLTTVQELVGKEGKGPVGQRVKEMNKTKKIAKVKDGGLMEATAKLKAKGFSEGGAVVKDKIVSIDKSPNSGLITVKGFGAGRRT